MGFRQIGVWVRLFCAFGFFEFGLTAFVDSMENQNLPSKNEQQHERAAGDLTLRVDVEEVRIDAVVLDKKRHQITDLTADDFEIRQDGKLQKIVSCKYINDYQPGPKKQAGAATGSKAIPLLPTPMPTRDAVRRTIVFLVDDLSMLFKQVHYARMSIRKFVETQMQPGDVVAILQTSRGNAALQALTADKWQLLTMIDSIRWNVRNPDLPQIQFSALLYCLNALQDMPGRKFLIYMSPSIAPGASLLTDVAWRAGVVIHVLDISGLIYGLDLDAERSSHDRERFGLRSDNTLEILQASSRTMAEIMEKSELARKTGGIFTRNENFFLNGVGNEVEEEMKGYYLLSYVPPANTFDKKDQRFYHKIEINVRQHGSLVFTRDGFWAKPGIAEMPWIKAKNSLMTAMFSPFKYSDLKVNLASGYVDNRPKGYLLRAWLQLDGRDLGIMDEKDGSHSISFETAASTTDIMGGVQDLGNRQLKFHVNDIDIAWIRDQGFKFSLSLPTKSPGIYYVRMAVKDQVTGAIGSAYQLIEISDLKKERLNLSSIFVVNRDEDVSWILSTETRDARENSSTSQSTISRSQALRRYLPGEGFEYMSIIYNAKSKEGTLPDLESHFVLYRNGDVLYTSPAELVNLGGISDFKRIPIRKKLQLESTLQPGDYILQLVVTDKKTDKKNRDATQVLPFEVLGKQSAN
jgi:VWFA-related protein